MGPHQPLAGPHPPNVPPSRQPAPPRGAATVVHHGVVSSEIGLFDDTSRVVRESSGGVRAVTGDS